MTTVEAMTNGSAWENILNVMTTELDGPERSWASVGGYRSHYYNPVFRAPVRITIPRAAARKEVKRKVIWSRVLLPILALSCVLVFRANQNVESQYQADVQSVYSKLGP